MNLAHQRTKWRGKDMINKLIALLIVLILFNPIMSFGKSNGMELIDAAFKGDKDAVNRLLDAGVNPNSHDSDGATALMYASLKGHTHVVQLLLTRGASINAKGTYGDTALMNAAWGGHVDVVKLLLKKGANPNAIAESSTGPVTAMSQAKIRGHDEIVQILKKAGAKR